MKVEDIELEINQEQLDREWLIQPLYAEAASRELSDARFSLDKAKSELDVVRAELDVEIRKNPEKFGIPKLTEKAVENTIVLCEEYQKAKEKVAAAAHEVGVLSALVTALEHRKKALENLVSLFGMSYFGKPQATTEEAKEGQKRSLRNRVKNRKKRAE